MDLGATAQTTAVISHTNKLTHTNKTSGGADSAATTTNPKPASGVGSAPFGSPEKARELTLGKQRETGNSSKEKAEQVGEGVCACMFPYLALV
jgi:hypothetical protein